MAFVVEDGTGLSTANSYISTADADTYFSDRNITDWAGYTTAQKQGALIYATTYVDASYRWYGTVYVSTQSLGWPRNVTIYDKEGRSITSGSIPQQLKDAVCELAYQHIQDNLNNTDSEGVQSESIGSSSITYKGGAASKSFSFIKGLLKDLGTSSYSRENTIYRN